MIAKKQLFILIMLFTASLINYMDRSALSIVVPIIQKNFNISPSSMGIILSAFFIGYALFNFIGGYFSDKIGPKKVLGGAMVIWSFFGGLTAVTYNFASLFVVRLFFGFGEGPIGSATNKTVNNWFQVRQRARAMAWATSAMPLGAAIAGPFIGLIAVNWGWRAPFAVLLVIGVIWALIWAKYAKDAPQESEERPEIVNHKVTSEGLPARKPKLSESLRQPRIWSVALAFFACNYIVYFFLTWFPTYLVNVHHLSIVHMSFVTAIPWLLGTAGTLLGGYLSDGMAKKTGNPVLARKMIIVSCLSGCAFSVAALSFVTSTAAAVTLMSIGVFFEYLIPPSIWAMVQDSVPQEHVGGAGGFVHSLSNLSGIIGPTVTGVIVQTTGSYNIAFVIAALLALVGAVTVAWLNKPIRSSAKREMAV
ncbi:MFS transporter [Paenibacillus sp. P25]|nr:MFS transporter [Paenibacillus sp. P25]